jgi:hypothetical protein
VLIITRIATIVIAAAAAAAAIAAAVGGRYAHALARAHPDDDV